MRHFSNVRTITLHGSRVAYRDEGAGEVQCFNRDDMDTIRNEIFAPGVEPLRVVDASAMPVVPSGNCRAGIVMMAERCADLIKGETLS